MPKGKLTRLEGLREAILEILSEHDHPTTNKIQKLVRDKGIQASWITTKNYLEELEQEGQVSRTILGEEFKMSAWRLNR
jgi:Fe2+ or Zn2+ uptake regulation protein